MPAHRVAGRSGSGGGRLTRAPAGAGRAAEAVCAAAPRSSRASALLTSACSPVPSPSRTTDGAHTAYAGRPYSAQRRPHTLHRHGRIFYYF